MNPLIEKPPQHNGIPSKTNHIPQHQLRPQTPPEESKVARMPENTINPMPNKLMALLALDLHVMVEVACRLRHRQRPDPLADSHAHEA